MEIVQAVKKLNSISRERLNFRRRSILCTTLYRNLMQASNFGGTFDQIFLKFFYKIFTEDASLPLLYHGAKKSKMTKISNQGWSCLKFAFEIKLCWITRLHVIFGPFFGTKRWIALELKRYQKSLTRYWRKDNGEEVCQTRAVAAWKLKGKENCENEHRETANFMYNFVQKTNATVQLWWHFIPTSPLNFFPRFSPEDPF